MPSSPNIHSLGLQIPAVLLYEQITAFKDSNYRPKNGDVIYYYLTSDKKGRSCAANASITKELHQLRSASKGISVRKEPKSRSRKLLILEVAILSFFPLIGILKLVRFSSALPFAFLYSGCLYLGMSLLAYFLYAEDKSYAKQGKRRIPEKTLHLVEMMGGWPGAFIAQRNLNHKSIKTSYQVEFRLIVAIHLIAWIVWLCFG